MTDVDAYPRIMLIPSVGEYPIYDEKLYSVMTADTIRVEAFERAVRRHAPGRTVLDIGTGADANWALVAAEAGATRVWAVEALPEAAEKARALVAERGFDHIITVLTGTSREIDLPERVDVCVSETIGTIASSEGICAVFDDAARRLVRASGVFIPHRAETTAVPFDFDAVLAGADPTLMDEYAPYVERVFAAVGNSFDLRLCWTEIPPEGRLATPAVVEDIRFGGAAHEFGTTATPMRITRPGRFTGIALGIRLWVSPDDPAPIDSLDQQTSWLPLFVPADSDTPRTVTPGDEFTLTFGAQPGPDGIHPDYTLSARFTDADHNEITWAAPHHGSGNLGDNPFYRRVFTDAR
ncbi:class I SAM-dependent methyltransferase [Nocardia terpenica]|uniref:class I SAM-dependent methyltransferase n=1 Tax=Nocardia terpenica TaxID=455432 RepID=UPI001894E8F9|nr:class I SAM-dependent methyltransferase [Nocardia terpenica]MBF6061660.1 class I SAM-dependent methyltransferase [Nocardia terpenica]MBF6107545.1 class I SAM-dependent methyltransferase [Nocardia terpenica]MBF6110080.1 class I SAM-dependent methyltransferase [Nocardia terpenica]MBF6122408.1 class I SAM-dependent methyltransferase [Nocardia terpenica]MBF6151416.1 class I SAM-dependent methyltransferase [Nocardia terpenica]